MRWVSFYGPHYCSLIHFYPWCWMLMAQHAAVGAKGMLCPGWHRYRPYRQTVAKEPGLLLLGNFREMWHRNAQRASMLTKHATDSANNQALDFSITCNRTWISMQGHVSTCAIFSCLYSAGKTLDLIINTFAFLLYFYKTNYLPVMLD